MSILCTFLDLGYRFAFVVNYTQGCPFSLQFDSTSTRYHDGVLYSVHSHTISKTSDALSTHAELTKGPIILLVLVMIIKRKEKMSGVSPYHLLTNLLFQYVRRELPLNKRNKLKLIPHLRERIHASAPKLKEKKNAMQCNAIKTSECRRNFERRRGGVCVGFTGGGKC